MFIINHLKTFPANGHADKQKDRRTLAITMSSFDEVTITSNLWRQTLNVDRREGFGSWYSQRIDAAGANWCPEAYLEFLERGPRVERQKREGRGSVGAEGSGAGGVPPLVEGGVPRKCFNFPNEMECSDALWGCALSPEFFFNVSNANSVFWCTHVTLF